MALVGGNDGLVKIWTEVGIIGMNERELDLKLAVAGLEGKQTGKLPAIVRIAIGMKAMVVLNIATEADIANGTRGEIQDIILDE